MDVSKNKSEGLALMITYISGLDNKEFEVYKFISCKLYLVNRLKTNILVANDVLHA